MELFASLLERSTDVAAIESPRACFDVLAALDSTATTSIERAVMGGFVADRIGYAFLAGYRAALGVLDPALSRASLCATEEGGAQPRAIRTRLASHDGAFVLDGRKAFATLASAADTLVVVASRGESEGRNHLQIACIPATRAGIAMHDHDPLPMAPEIPHAVITFTAVRVAPSEVWDGDGYDRVLKPFRTIEDIHVMAAWLGHVVRVARASDPRREIVERALGSIAGLADLAKRSPTSPAVHIALAGVLEETKALAGDVDLAAASEPIRSRWKRDLPLLAVAGTARHLRREAAWRAFMPPAP